jgi:hypothetical protein
MCARYAPTKGPICVKRLVNPGADDLPAEASDGGKALVQRFTGYHWSSIGLATIISEWAGCACLWL